MAWRLFTGCMKAMRAPGATLATSSISGIEATSKDVTPFFTRVSMTHGEGSPKKHAQGGGERLGLAPASWHARLRSV
jgi:hypothetical protein